MNPETTYKNFGYLFLGPILARYFKWLEKKLKEKPQADSKLYFLAREGYFLKQVYERIKKESPTYTFSYDSDYLLLSRSFLFKLNSIKNNHLKDSLIHPYNGSLNQFFSARYGFSRDEILAICEASKTFSTQKHRTITIPSKSDLIIKIFNEAQEVIENIVAPKRNAYQSYLESKGVYSQKKIIVIDIGFSGTIQKQLSLFTNQKTSGFYFIALNTTHNTDALSMNGCFAENIRFGQGITMLDRSLFIESLLTAPHGQTIDIMPAKTTPFSDSFIFGQPTEAQLAFPKLERIIDGATEYILEKRDDSLIPDTGEVLAYYETLIRNKHIVIPKELHPIFDVDDSISGLGVLNPNTFFS